MPIKAATNALLSTPDALSRNLGHLDDDQIDITLDAGQSVTCVGEYDLSVLKGAVAVYGAFLHPASGTKRVYAPTTHALPQITAGIDATTIRISSIRSSIRKLEKLSPLFRNIWTDAPQRTFSLLRTSSDDTLQRTLLPLDVDKALLAVLSRLAAHAESNARSTRVMTIGAKSSGKSTFNRFVCNYITSRTRGKRCFYLDLDPGQPEFGPPGQVSLVEVNEAILGPPFTHPASAGSRAHRLLRSHTLAATSFKDDAAHYLACAKDLVTHVDRRFPLVINSCGWVSGLGASVLIELINILSISDAVILEPLETSFTAALQQASADVTFHRLARQAPRPSSRTPAESRNMQTMAYMHHKRRSSGSQLRWSETPISAFRPWTASYGKSGSGIHAVLSYGQSPGAEFLSEVLDGALVAIVVIEEGSLAEAFHLHEGPQQQSVDENIGTDNTPSASDDLIQRTPQGLPYIRPNDDGFCPPLNPTYSACVGIALIRGIDHECQSLQLVTPLSEHEIAGLMRHKVVLIRGDFDPPAWAYLEDIYSKEGDGDMRVDADRPWVSKKDMVGIEGAVWRLRHPPMASAVGARQ